MRWALIVVLAGLVCGACAGDNNSENVHCFNQRTRTLPSFTSVDCPTINPTTNNTTTTVP